MARKAATGKKAATRARKPGGKKAGGPAKGKKAKASGKKAGRTAARRATVRGTRTKRSEKYSQAGAPWWKQYLPTTD